MLDTEVKKETENALLKHRSGESRAQLMALQAQFEAYVANQAGNVRSLSLRLAQEGTHGVELWLMFLLRGKYFQVSRTTVCYQDRSIIAVSKN